MRVESYTLAQVHEVIHSCNTLQELADQLKVRRSTLSQRLQQRHHEDKPLTFAQLKCMTTEELHRQFPDDYDKPLVNIERTKKRLHADPTTDRLSAHKRHHPALKTQGLFARMPTPTDADHQKTSDDRVMVHLKLPYPMMFPLPQAKPLEPTMKPRSEIAHASASTDRHVDGSEVPITRSPSRMACSSETMEGLALPTPSSASSSVLAAGALPKDEIDFIDPALLDLLASFTDDEFNDRMGLPRNC